MTPSIPFNDWLIKKHLKDPKNACAYLNAALEEGDRHHFLITLRNVAEAQGGLLALARRTRMNRGHLYRLLSHGGNPEITSLERLLEAMGFGFQISVLKSKHSRRHAA